MDTLIALGHWAQTHHQIIIIILIAVYVGMIALLLIMSMIRHPETENERMARLYNQEFGGRWRAKDIDK